MFVLVEREDSLVIPAQYLLHDYIDVLNNILSNKYAGKVPPRCPQPQVIMMGRYCWARGCASGSTISLAWGMRMYILGRANPPSRSTWAFTDSFPCRCS